MKTTAISLSLDAIIAQILAESALRFLGSESAPELLNSDQSKALETLVRARFNLSCLDLLPIIDDLNDGAEENLRTMSIEVRSIEPATAVVLRLALEHCIAIGTLSYIYSDSASSASALYAEAFEQARLRLRDIVLTSRLPADLSIRPCRY